MKRSLLLISVLVAGFGVSVAVAKPPPSKGNSGSKSSASSSTATSAAGEKKIAICHRTNSAKKSFVLIRVSKRAEKAHLRHGDVRPTDGGCPTAVEPAETEPSETPPTP